jgi:hypothetical protein
MNIKITNAAAAFLAAAMMALPAAGLADMVDIDCSSSSFVFADDGYHVDCQRSDGQVRAEQSTGASQVDVMNISGDDPRMFMTVVGIRVTATRIYLEHRSLRENFDDVFSDIEAEDWKAIGKKDGYDRAEFTAEISGLPSSCVAIQRYTNPAWIGFKRRIIGMGCSPIDRGFVYAALTKLRAPGD